METSGLLWRAIVAFLALPTVVAFVVPWMYFSQYLAVLTILVAWAVGFRSIGLSVYAASMAIVFHLRVVFFEEPWQARIFGNDWLAYRARVPRWIGRASWQRRDHRGTE